MVLRVLWIKILFIKLTNSSKHSLMLAKIGIEVHLMHEFMPPEPFVVFFCSKHAQSTTLGLNSCFGRFHAILLPHPTRCKYLCRGAFNARVCASKTIFLLGRNEHAQSTTLGLKLIFKIFLDTSMHFYKAFGDT